MRSSLLVSGFCTLLLGLALYLLEIPFGFSWSITFMAGGVIIMVAALFAKEQAGQADPPEGHRFCLFCNNPMLLTATRCDYCNGLQSL